MPEIEKAAISLLTDILTRDANDCWPMPKTCATPYKLGPPRINLTRYLYTVFVGELAPEHSLERRPYCHPDCQNPFHRALGNRGRDNLRHLSRARVKTRNARAILATVKDLPAALKELLQEAPATSRAEAFEWFSTQDPNFIGLTIEEFNDTLSENPGLFPLE